MVELEWETKRLDNGGGITLATAEKLATSLGFKLAPCPVKMPKGKTHA